MISHPYWLDIKCIKGSQSFPEDADIVIIGSGLAGISTAYWLQEKGYNNILLIDDEPEKSATFRNCGHILYGTVESMLALSSIHGEETARKLWELSVDICHEVKHTIERHSIDASYRQDGYLVIAVDENEDDEILRSIELLNKHGFDNRYVCKGILNKMGFKDVYGARYEIGSAQAHPTKFRNGLLEVCLTKNLKYHSGIVVKAVDESGDKVVIKTERGDILCEAAVIAANAYSPLLSRFFKEHRLVDPFRGQIITSAPIQHEFSVKFPHSFDHGYEYALVTEDNRLMIGGWRNHVENGEVGMYDLNVNPHIEQGLKAFVEKHYDIKEDIRWEYSWSGIMAASKTGFPFIGPTDSPRIFTCAGFTGHGFSWAHGSAKILADIINGDPIPEIVKERCNPRVR